MFNHQASSGKRIKILDSSELSLVFTGLEMWDLLVEEVKLLCTSGVVKGVGEKWLERSGKVAGGYHQKFHDGHW